MLKLAIAERYRVGLNATQYQKLLAAVKHARANNSPYWNAVLNNCNTYIGQFPASVFANMAGFKRNDAYFQASEASRQAPKVQFNLKDQPQSQTAPAH